MSIFNHENYQEVCEDRFHAEKMLDKIYHAIPEWVHREFPNCSLAEKVQKGFEYQQKQWTETFLNEVKEHDKLRQFNAYLIKTLGIDFMTHYWNFLISKDLEKANEIEKKVLTGMKKPV